MFTRCFAKTDLNDKYNVIYASDYGVEWYIDGELTVATLVEDLDKLAELLLNDDFVEVE